MSSIIQKCTQCGNNITFDENPYSNPNATKYWRSQYEKPTEFLFSVMRKTPSVNRKGEQVVITKTEYVTKVFCGPECGLENEPRK